MCRSTISAYRFITCSLSDFSLDLYYMKAKTNFVVILTDLLQEFFVENSIFMTHEQFFSFLPKFWLPDLRTSRITKLSEKSQIPILLWQDLTV